MQLIFFTHVREDTAFYPEEPAERELSTIKLIDSLVPIRSIFHIYEPLLKSDISNRYSLFTDRYLSEHSDVTCHLEKYCRVNLESAASNAVDCTLDELCYPTSLNSPT